MSVCSARSLVELGLFTLTVCLLDAVPVFDHGSGLDVALVPDAVFVYDAVLLLDLVFTSEANLYTLLVVRTTTRRRAAF